MALLGEWILLAMLFQTVTNHSSSQPQNRSQAAARSEDAVTLLTFKEFFVDTNGELKPSARLLELNGKRVRLVGFMAQTETPPLGAFYLCPWPIICDEEGAGTADLPLESVLVIVRSLKSTEVPFSPRALEVTGLLEVGNRQEPDGRVSFVRLILDRPEESPAAGRSSTHNSIR